MSANEPTCHCGHSMYEHYMCGAPSEMGCYRRRECGCEGYADRTLVSKGRWKRAVATATAPMPDDSTGWNRLVAIAKLPANWDSYGAPSIDPRAIETARKLLALTDSRPQIVPTSHGGVQLEWHGGGSDVEVVIPPEGGTEFYASAPATDAPAEREMTAVSRRDYIDSLDWATRELLNKYGARTDGIAALERLRDWLALSVPVEP